VSEAHSEVDALLAADLSKRYGETVALANVDLSLPTHRIVGLVGENGAGKSTLLNIISGIARADSGTLEVHGAGAWLDSYATAQRLGISRVFQEQALILNIPVYENLLLGAEAMFTSGLQWLHRRAMVRLAQSMMDESGASIDVRRHTGDLTFSERQVVEIVRACVAPRALYGVASPIVLFDEPTASLEKAHEQIFRRLLERLRADGAGLFVSHRLGEILDLCDEIVVLKDGRRVGAIFPEDADERSLHRLMVGRERDTDYYHESKQVIIARAKPALGVRGFKWDAGAKAVSFDVMPGEIVGIGGLLESGKSELGRAIVGLDADGTTEVKVGAGAWRRPSMQALIASKA
jgi:ribose transport system ATP-binding protein